MSRESSFQFDTGRPSLEGQVRGTKGVLCGGVLSSLTFENSAEMGSEAHTEPESRGTSSVPGTLSFEQRQKSPVAPSMKKTIMSGRYAYEYLLPAYIFRLPELYVFTYLPFVLRCTLHRVIATRDY